MLAMLAGGAGVVLEYPKMTWASAVERPPGVRLFVSTDGRDAWSGRLAKPNKAGSDGPFETLERARDEVRRIKQEAGVPKGGVVVEILGGRHERSKPFILTSEDSGTTQSPVVYRGRPGAEVRISGGRIVTDWQPVTDTAILDRLPRAARGQVLQASLKALRITEYGDLAVDVGCRLQRMVARMDGQGEYTMGSVPPKRGAKRPERLGVFFNGRPMQIARGPNDGQITIEETLGKTIRNVRGHKSSVEGIFRYKGDYPKRWVGEKDAYVCGSWCRDWAEQRHRIEALDTEKRVISVHRPYHYYGYAKGHWFYGFNILAELDRPGEWYIDRDTGILYFWPPERIGRAKVEVSMAPALVKMTDTSHVTIRGLVFEATRGTAIAIENGQHCRVVGCALRNLGMHAVTVVGGKENGVVGCDMHGMGGGGVYLIGGDRKTLTPAGHYAENNHIHHYGRWDRMYRPAIVLTGVGLRASHNLIHNAPHSAIIFGGNEHLIELNEIHSVCYDSNDCGAIYVGRDWTIRGHVIRHNYFHHLYGRKGRACRGIYLDDSFAAATVQGNVFYQATYAFFLGCGRDNMVENNVFVDCPSAMHIDARGLGWQKPHIDRRLKEATQKGTLRGIRFKEPPYSTRYPQLLTLLDDDPAYPKGNVVRRNIFWPGDGADLRRQARGADPGDSWWDHIDPKIKHLVTLEDNLINEDPKFVDEKAGNFQLRADSPAWKLGFQRIPIEKIGLYRDERRASWPAVHTVRPMPAPLPPLPAKKRKKRVLRTGPPPVFKVLQAAAAITIDGDVTPAEWAGAQPDKAMVIERGLYHERVAPRSLAWLAHDRGSLYVAIVNGVETTKPLAMGARWGRDDAVEVALRNPGAGKNAPIFVLRGYPNGRFESSGEARAPDDQVRAAGEAVTFAARVVDAAHWAAEYQIPLRVLGDLPSRRAGIELNISVRKSAKPAWVMWQGTGGKTWETPKAGLIELSD